MGIYIYIKMYVYVYINIYGSFSASTACGVRVAG